MNKDTKYGLWQGDNRRGVYPLRRCMRRMLAQGKYRLLTNNSKPIKRMKSYENSSIKQR